MKKLRSISAWAIMILFVASCNETPNGRFLAEEHTSLSNKIAIQLMSTYESALEVYKEKNGSYPLCSGPYVCNEILPYLAIDEIYWYCDDSTEVRHVDISEKCKRRFIAVGQPRSRIIYQCTDEAHYNLIFYGYNGNSEGGAGDDLIVRR